MVAKAHLADWLSPRSSHNKFLFRFKYFPIFFIILTTKSSNIVFSMVAEAIAQLLRSILQRGWDEESPENIRHCQEMSFLVWLLRMHPRC